METLAAVMTGKGIGAISSIQLIGEAAPEIIVKIFKPAGPLKLDPGKILLGELVDGSKVIDQVVLGCEGKNNFVIHCHGSPLIVELIMELLQRVGAQPVPPERILKETFISIGSGCSVVLEAKIAQRKARSLEGTKIILNQINGGLTKEAIQWLKSLKTEPAVVMDEIPRQARVILKESKIAKLIINGCRVAIAGQPNSGKSTLLNTLCGKQKSIVSDILGTTRDWVCAGCHIESLYIEFIDTAGLDEAAISRSGIDKAAQEKTRKVLADCDLVLLVLDGSKTAGQLNKMLAELTSKKIITLLNKSDLPSEFDEKMLPAVLGKPLKISALLGSGLEALVLKIRQILGVADFDLRRPVYFTNRQKELLEKLAAVNCPHLAAQIITELLNGEVRI